ncbi:MAG: DMT family transporter [Bacillota bacterium]
MITIVFWALAFVFTRLALQFFTAFSLGFLRYFAASVTLVLVIAKLKINPPRKKDFHWYVVSAASGFFLYMIFFNTGTKYVTAATSSIVIATTPIITALLASVFFKERLKVYQWMAVLIEFAGILILTLTGGSFSVNIGVCWLLVAALLISIYNLIQRKLTKTYNSLQVSAYSILMGTVMLAIFAPTSLKEIQQAPSIQFFYIAILGVFSSAIAYVSWAKAFSKAKNTSDVSNYMFVTPLITGILGFIIAGEVPEMSTVFGGIVIILGVLLFNKESLINKNRVSIRAGMGE